MRYFRANRKIVSNDAAFEQFAPLNALVSKMVFAIFIHNKSEAKFTSLLNIIILRFLKLLVQRNYLQAN